jgi:hypothetical protein
MYSLFVCAAIKKVTMVSKHTIIQLFLYPWVTGHLYASILSKKAFFLNLMPKGGQFSFVTLNFSKYKNEGV